MITTIRVLLMATLSLVAAGIGALIGACLAYDAETYKPVCYLLVLFVLMWVWARIDARLANINSGE